jgi:uncharacterized repeat protein (TIGR03803 family)
MQTFRNHAAIVLCAIVLAHSNAATAKKIETIIYSFNNPINGDSPASTPVIHNDHLYGTASGGSGSCYSGCGVVYKIDLKTNTEKVVYNFQGGSDGDFPNFAVLAISGDFAYGTTVAGGSKGDGTLYSLNLITGQEQVEYSFDAGGGGFNPGAGVIDVGGVLYGTTTFGSGGAGSNGFGTVFEFNLSTHQYKTLYSFAGAGDGEYPGQGSLIFVNGLIYGTTTGSNANPCITDCGTIFSVDPTSGTETVLYSFGGGTDGASPNTGLTYSNGYFYGVTFRGGAKNRGTVFRFDLANGVETVLKSLGGAPGSGPDSNLIVVGDTLYGTTFYGGQNHAGTAFRMNVSGQGYKVIFAFGNAFGNGSSAGLSRHGADFYGVTQYRGTAFKISPNQ